MTQQPCPNCPALARIIQQQQNEIAMLRRIIAEATGACMALANEAETKQRGHVPTGVWAYNQGQKDAVQKVLDKLER